MAVGLCENMPGQFKLVETPLNSFLLITNVLPNDERPWISQNNSDIDFSHLRFDRLNLLDEILSYSPKACNKKPLQKVELQCPYVIYEGDSWVKAMWLNKDALIQEIMAKISNPLDWNAVAIEDPLALIWVLFYGNNSFCSNEQCLYQKKFGIKGPVLLPPEIYNMNDVQSLISIIAKCVKCLYKSTKDVINPDLVPFSYQRINKALALLAQLEDCCYISKVCLLCALYQQNEIIMSHGNGVGACLILGGKGSTYINKLSSERFITVGDGLILPSYNLTALIEDFNFEDGAKQKPSIN